MTGEFTKSLCLPVILSAVEESSLMPKAIRIKKKSDRNRNAMKISRLVGLNSKAELLLLRSYFLVFPFLFYLSLPLKNMAVICISALLFLFSFLFILSFYSTSQLNGGELGNFCFNGDRRVAIAYFPYVANDVYPPFKRKVSCYTPSNGLYFFLKDLCSLRKSL